MLEGSWLMAHGSRLMAHGSWPRGAGPALGPEGAPGPPGSGPEALRPIFGGCPGSRDFFSEVIFLKINWFYLEIQGSFGG